MWPSRRQVRAAVGADLRRRRGSPGCGRHVPVLITAAWLFISMEILPQLPPPPPPPPPRLCTCGERHRPRELASRGGGSGTGLARPPPPGRLRASAVTAQGTERKLASRAPERGPGTPGLPHPRGPQHLPGWRDFRAPRVGQNGWLWSRDRDLWVTGSEGRVNRGLHARAKGSAQKKASKGDWPGPGSGGQETAAPQAAGTLRREGRGKPSARVAPRGASCTRSGRAQ